MNAKEELRRVNCSLQDRRGFVWIGTDNGLARYDGQSVLYFTKENGGLPSNKIDEMFVDEAGILWLVSHTNGVFHKNKEVCFFDPATCRAQGIAAKFGNSFPLPVEQICRFVKSGTHNINMLSPDMQIYTYDVEKGFLPPRTEPGLDLDIRFNRYYLSKESALTVATTWYDAGLAPESQMSKIRADIAPSDAGIYGEKRKYSTQSQTINIPFLSDINNLEYVNIFHRYPNGDLLLMDRQSKNWLEKLSSKGHKTTLGKQVTLHRDGYLQNHVAFREKDHSLWYASDEDFIVYFTEDDQFVDFKTTYPEIFGTRVVKHLHFGQNGLVWASTDDGLFAIEVKHNLFTHYLYKDPSVHSQNQRSSCRGIHQVEDQLIIGYYPNNCAIFNKDRPAQPLLLPNFLPIPIMYPFQEKYTMVGASGWAFKWDVKSNALDTLDTNRFNTHSYISIAPVGDSALLIGALDGVYYWQEGTETIAPLELWNKAENLGGQNVNQILQIGENIFLLATSFGIYEMSLENGLIAHYSKDGIGKYHFPFYDISHLQENGEDRYWIATKGSGLIHWERRSGEYEQYTIEDGLPSDLVCAVYADEEGSLWIPTFNGLAMMDPKTNLFRVFTEADGLTHNEFNTLSHFQAADGRLYFGGLNGVNAFYPKDIKTEQAFSPAMYVTSFAHFDRGLKRYVDKMGPFTQDAAITIRPNDIFTSISFALLDFKDPESIRFDYKIKNLDNTWHYLNGNTLELSGLPFGNYQLIVRGQNINSRSSPQMLEFPIKVMKPFYYEWWFYFILAALTGGLIYLHFKNKNRRLTRQKAELEAEVVARMKKIAEQQSKMEQDQKLIKEQAAEIRMLGQVIQTSRLPTEDAQWIKALEETIQERMSDPHFKAQELASAMHLSRTQFHRRLKAVTGLTPGAWLQETRLQRAKELLENKAHHSIKAVALDVGINPGYFAEAYKKRFGKLPTEV